MAYTDRLKIIQRIENLRGSTVICYLTSLRQNVPSQIAEDAVRIIFDHLLRLPQRPTEKLDLFLCSNGGSGTVPWRLVALFREFTDSFNVLIPYRAYSAASLLALGANEIVMHPFAELGPIDPTVQNNFNPDDPVTRQKIGISVEDVKAYVNFIKSTVGITHQDQLIKAIEALADKVHPLALGNVERFLSQSRMVAKKVLLTHMHDADDHTVNEIIENMASKLYFHGHPINRREAQKDLRLKVNVDLQPELETAMWELYVDYESEFQNLEMFNPAGDILRNASGQDTYQEEHVLLHALVESRRLTSRYTSTRRVIGLYLNDPGKATIRDDVIEQRWTQADAPEEPALPQSSI